MKKETFGLVSFDSYDEDAPLLFIRYYQKTKEFSFDFNYGYYFAPSNRRPINEFLEISSSKESFIEYCEKSIKVALPTYTGEGKVIYYRLNKLYENLRDIKDTNKVEYVRVIRMFKKIRYTVIIVKKNKHEKTRDY